MYQHRKVQTRFGTADYLTIQNSTSCAEILQVLQHIFSDYNDANVLVLDVADVTNAQMITEFFLRHLGILRSLNPDKMRMIVIFTKSKIVAKFGTLLGTLNGTADRVKFVSQKSDIGKVIGIGAIGL